MAHEIVNALVSAVDLHIDRCRDELSNFVNADCVPSLDERDDAKNAIDDLHDWFQVREYLLEGSVGKISPGTLKTLVETAIEHQRS